ncbi:hypothetical protein [Mycobacterium stomatepiae]|uniref:Uncharacterized protein n=1 Tax=Mycobacterium stomatepiae TaxID=470076 RepID=A0A7I7Q0I0_9MYCO|nr:hypothetical protein [Mycobacterium stomatepiae]BBY19865.1 hypothetical protein MSTO_00700 [Mycobacterium stomatepiae]
MALSEYEQEQLKRVNAHKKRTLKRSSRRLIPFTVSGLSSGLAGQVLKLPGLREAKDQGTALFDGAAAGAGKVMSRTSQRLTLK